MQSYDALSSQSVKLARCATAFVTQTRRAIWLKQGSDAASPKSGWSAAIVPLLAAWQPNHGRSLSRIASMGKAQKEKLNCSIGTIQKGRTTRDQEGWEPRGGMRIIFGNFIPNEGLKGALAMRSRRMISFWNSVLLKQRHYWRLSDHAPAAILSLGNLPSLSITITNKERMRSDKIFSVRSEILTQLQAWGQMKMKIFTKELTSLFHRSSLFPEASRLSKICLFLPAGALGETICCTT